MDISIIKKTTESGDLLSLAQFLDSVDLNELGMTISKECEQGDGNVHHHFGPGLYIRELIAPKNAFMIGFKQRFPHMNVFLKGRVLMFNGGKVVDMKAPMLFVAPPGQKCGIVIEDMVWLNVYATNETNVGKLEEMFLEKPEEVDQYTRHQLDIAADREDYKKLLEEVGMTEEQVQAEVQRTDTIMEMPHGTYSFAVYPSPLHGNGVFATSDITKGDYIGLAARGLKRTPLGRWTNHSRNPNACFITANDETYLVAIEDIKGNVGGQFGHEITIDYRCTPRHRRN